MAMINDRNLTSRTDNDDLSTAIHGRLAAHAALMERWLRTLEDSMAKA
jgi:hypothetical protein